VPVNSRAKGARGELEFSAFLREHGFAARRGQQFSGGGDSPDVVSDVPGVHFEIKRTESLSLWPAMDQARRDAAAGKVPVVCHRPSRRKWIAILDAEDFLNIMKTVKQTTV